MKSLKITDQGKQRSLQTLLFSLMFISVAAVTWFPCPSFAQYSLYNAAETNNFKQITEILDYASRKKLNFANCWDAESCTSGGYSQTALQDLCWDPDKGIRSVLHIAAYKGHIEAVNLLLNAGFDPNIPSRAATYKAAPIYEASFGGHADVVLALHRAGARVEANDQTCPPSDKISPLHLAARNGKVHATMALLAVNANPEVEDAWGRTPLHVAAENGHREVVASLLATDINPDPKTKEGNTPLHYAIGSGMATVPTLLAFGADPNLRNSKGQFPLIQATRANGITAVSTLLVHGADVDVTDKKGTYSTRTCYKNESGEAD